MIMKQALSYLQLKQIGGLSNYVTSGALLDDILKYQNFISINSRRPNSIEEFNAFNS